MGRDAGIPQSTSIFLWLPVILRVENKLYLEAEPHSSCSKKLKHEKILFF